MTFYGLCLFNEGQARVWPYPRANSEYTINVLHRLRAELPRDPLVLI